MKMQQKLKALVESEHGQELRGAKSENEQQTIEYNGPLEKVLEKARLRKLKVS